MIAPRWGSVAHNQCRTGSALTQPGTGYGVCFRKRRRLMPRADETPDAPTLDIPTDKLAFIIEKAREYDVKEGDSDPDEGSNPIDDGHARVWEHQAGDPTREELIGAIRELNSDERAELVA